MPFAQLGIKWWQRKKRRTRNQIGEDDGDWWNCPKCGQNRMQPSGEAFCWDCWEKEQKKKAEKKRQVQLKREIKKM